MEVVNKVAPTEEQMKGFLEPGREGPIYMLNLLKFKEKAEYADGRETNLSGAEAYAIYGQEVVHHLQKVGGAPMFSAGVERLMLGEVEELWDTAAIAMIAVACNLHVNMICCAAVVARVGVVIIVWW